VFGKFVCPSTALKKQKTDITVFLQFNFKADTTQKLRALLRYLEMGNKH